MSRMRIPARGWILPAVTTLVLTAPGSAAFAAIAAQRPCGSGSERVFERNVGQSASEVRFLSRAGSSTLFLTAHEAVLALDAGAVRLRFLGGNPHARIVPENELSGRMSYLLGDDPGAWRTGVPTHGAVRYEDVYPGVDLVFRGAGADIEFDLVLSEGADTHAIDLSIEGADEVAVEAGDAVLRIGAAVVRLKGPVAFQETGGRRVFVPARWVAEGGCRLGFELGAHDASAPLVIDPTIVSDDLVCGDSTLGFAVAVGADGGTVVVGTSASPTFPATSGVFQPTNKGSLDAFVQKRDAYGNLVFSTLFGGSGIDEATAVGVDAALNVWFGGYTSSQNLPTKNAAQPQIGGSFDAFLAKLDPTGAQLLSSTYLGGSGLDAIAGLKVDAHGGAYVTGYTQSQNFPTTPGAFQTASGGGEDAFVAHVLANGLKDQATLLGGARTDFTGGIDVDPKTGNVYVAGGTTSANFPLKTPFQGALDGAGDAFISILSPDLKSLLSSTYFGGSGQDAASGIVVLPDGSFAIAGGTTSPDLPQSSSLPPELLSHIVGARDAFVARFRSPGGLAFTRYLGGNGNDQANAIAAGPDFSILITGSTFSPDFPTVNAPDPEGGGGVLRSPNGDRPFYFSNRGLKGGINALAVDPSNPSLVYGAGPAPYTFARSADGGMTWKETPLGATGNAVASAQNRVFLATDHGMAVSLDSGLTFTPFVNLAGSGTPPNALSVALGASNVLVGTGGQGIFRCGLDLTGCGPFNAGLTILRVNALTVTSAQTVLAGTGDATSGGVFFLTNGAASWSPASGLPKRAVLGFEKTFLNGQASVVAATQSLGGDGGVFASADEGKTWTPLLKTAFNLTSIGASSTALYAGAAAGTGRGVLRSNDGGATWSDVGLRNQGVGSILASGSVILAGVQGGGSGFLAQLDRSGLLQLSTFLPGTGAAQANGVVFGANGTFVAVGSSADSATPSGTRALGAPVPEEDTFQIGPSQEICTKGWATIAHDDVPLATIEKAIISAVPPMVGLPVKFAITVTNKSGKKIESPDISDDLEGYTEYDEHGNPTYDFTVADVAFDPPQPGCQVNTKYPSSQGCKSHDLAPGESVTLVVTIIPKKTVDSASDKAYVQFLGDDLYTHAYGRELRYPVVNPNSTVPYISKISPNPALPGQLLTIEGSNLAYYPPDVRIRTGFDLIDGNPGIPLKFAGFGAGGSILVYAPDGTNAYIADEITVTTPYGKASAPFSMVAPEVHIVSPGDSRQVSVSPTGVKTFKLRLLNSGPSTATNVRLDCSVTDNDGHVIPGQSTISLAPSTAGSCAGATCTIDKMSPFTLTGGDQPTVTVTFKPAAQGIPPVCFLTCKITPDQVDDGDGTVGVGYVTGPGYVPPAVTGISPTSGAPGTQVEIDGSGLQKKGGIRREGERADAGTVATGTKVLFGLVEAPILSISDSKIVVAVPPGAPTGPITVTTVGSIDGPVFTITDGSSGTATELVAVVLSAGGLNSSFFTTETTFTNRGGTAVALTLTYTAAFGGGGGTAAYTVPAGRQVVIPDTITFLAELGIPIPTTGNRGGTLAVHVTVFSSAKDFAVTARTTTAVGGGRAGLAYPGILTTSALTGPSYVYALRQSTTDRSNLAVQHAGKSADGPITLRLTVFSGDDSTSKALPDVVLSPGGFSQVSGILASNGLSLANGYVRVERVSGSAPYYAYGVINDQANSDGSFVPPVADGSLAGVAGLTVPVLVEAGAFTSELTATNRSGVTKTLHLTYVASAIAAGSAATDLVLKSGQQTILPNFVQTLRDKGLVGPAGPAFAGALFVTVAGGDVDGIFVGVRTSAPGGGGRYGVFYGGVPNGATSTTSAWIYGLQQNEENRTNLAIVNTGETDGTDDTFTIDLYDGSSGKLVASVPPFALKAKEWRQFGTILAAYAPGAAQAYAHVTRTSGVNPFIAYGVINDGAAPGLRTGDGAFIESAP